MGYKSTRHVTRERALRLIHTYIDELDDDSLADVLTEVADSTFGPLDNFCITDDPAEDDYVVYRS